MSIVMVMIILLLHSLAQTIDSIICIMSMRVVILEIMHEALMKIDIGLQPAFTCHELLAAGAHR